jgi:RNA polymerase sigma factor (sigma-70 family)
MSAVAPEGVSGGGFATTHWSLIIQARGADPAARIALGELIRAYWYPVYAYFRRKTGSTEQAEDLTQGLFTHLLEGNALAEMDPSRGRFRSFLIACCKHFLLNDRARAAAQKRGGGVVPLSLDLSHAEARYRVEPVDHLTAERVYARTWALDLLDASLRDVQDQYRSGGNAAIFDRLKPTLTATGDAPAYAEIAGECGMSLAAVKKAAQRLRERYREALRRRVASTLADAASVDEEIRELFEALANR